MCKQVHLRGVTRFVTMGVTRFVTMGATRTELSYTVLEIILNLIFL